MASAAMHIAALSHEKRTEQRMAGDRIASMKDSRSLKFQKRGHNALVTDFLDASRRGSGDWSSSRAPEWVKSLRTCNYCNAGITHLQMDSTVVPFQVTLSFRLRLLQPDLIVGKSGVNEAVRLNHDLDCLSLGFGHCKLGITIAVQRKIIEIA